MTTFKNKYDIVWELLDAFYEGEGGTISTVAGVSVPTTGYVVGVEGYEYSIGTHYLKFHHPEKIVSEWVDSVKDRSGQPNYFLGVWVDGIITYFDLVQVFPEKQVAIDAAKDRGEIAIFDLGKQEEIRV